MTPFKSFRPRGACAVQPATILTDAGRFTLENGHRHTIHILGKIGVVWMENF
jgi:hypothetical protein